MIALDSSSFIAFLSGASGSDVESVRAALANKIAVFPPTVLTELLSDPTLASQTRKILLQIPLLSVTDGFWERAGLLRAKILSKGLKARLADTLIAQNCLDHEAGLVTRDGDFKNFAKISGLKLIS